MSSPVQPDAPPDGASPQALLSEFFGFESFRPGQLQVIQRILDGGHVLAVMPTGAGKSLCYQLPALASTDGLTLVVSPLIALMKDQVDELERLRIAATFINSSISGAEQRARMDAVRQERYRLLYVAPERFRSPLFRQIIEQTRVATVAIDEAHCISEWGHDFRPDYLKLRGVLQALRPRSVVALTATATPQVQTDIVEQLGLENAETIVTGFDRPNLAFSARRFSTERDKDNLVRRFVESREGSGIVYVSTRRAAEAVADLLYSYGQKAGAYHAGLEEKERTAVQDRFMSGETRIIVATNAFGMGIDKPDIRFVFHYNMPGSPEAYYQEAGRAGRDGDPAECVLCSSPADYRLGEFFIEQSYPSRDQIESVYRALLSAKADPIFWTLEQIRRAAAAEISESGASSCLRILEQFGAIQRLDPREHKAAILSQAPAAELRPRVKGPQKRRVFDALCKLLLAPDGTIQDDNVNLEVLAGRVGVDAALLQRHLHDLAQEGILEYHAPFRGRGVRLLGGGAPFESIPIDWESLDRRRAAEYEKLDAMAKYVAAAQCRRKWLVSYFGERFPGAADCSCDRCAGVRSIDQPSKFVDASAKAAGYTPPEVPIARALLACVEEIRGKVGVQKIVQIACGSQARWVVDGGLQRLRAYGSVKTEQVRANAIAMRLVHDDCLVQTSGVYPTVALTPKGRDVLAGRVDLPERKEISVLRPDVAPKKESAPDAPAPAPVDHPAPLPDEALFNALRNLRASEAKRRRIQPFKVLGDATLRDMARLRPRTPGQLLTIKGIGPAKAHKYGPVFLEAIIRASGPAKAAEEELPGEQPASQAVEDAPLPQDATPSPLPPGVVAELPPAPVQAAPPPLPDPVAILDSLARMFLESDREQAKEAFDRIRMFDLELALERLTALWDDSAPSRPRLRLVWAAGEIGQGGAEAWLAERLLSPEGEIRRQTCESLRKIAGPRAEALLLDRLAQDRDELVQLAAAAALGHIGGPSALSALERLVGSAACSEAVREASADALDRLRRSGAATARLVQPDFLTP